MALFPDYVTSGSLMSYVKTSDTAHEAEIALAITTASRLIDKATNRQFGKVDTATARLYTPEYDIDRGKYVLVIDDLMTLSGSSIAVDYGADGTYSTTVSTSAFATYPHNAAGDGKPWNRLLPGDDVLSLPSHEASVEITANWGWTEVPSTIKNATLLQAARLFKRRESPFGIAGSPEMGNEMRLLSKLDPDVEMMVGAYKRWWGAV